MTNVPPSLETLDAFLRSHGIAVRDVRADGIDIDDHWLDTNTRQWHDDVLTLAPTWAGVRDYLGY